MRLNYAISDSKTRDALLLYLPSQTEVGLSNWLGKSATWLSFPIDLYIPRLYVEVYALFCANAYVIILQLLIRELLKSKYHIVKGWIFC